jgi:hypothetical protein
VRSPRAPQASTGARRGAAAVAAAIALVAVALVSVVVWRARGDDRAAGGARCVGAVGDLSPELAAMANAGLWRDSLVAALADPNREKVAICPLGPARRIDDLVVQELRSNEGPWPAALAVSVVSPARRHYLAPTLWAILPNRSMHAAAVGEPRVDAPRAVTVAADGHVEVELDSGALLVARRFDEPYFYLHFWYAAPWRVDDAGLGLPTSHPSPGLTPRQDFEHGYAVVRTGAPPGTWPDIHLAEGSPADLPGEAAEGAVIVRQTDQTAWWLPRPGERRWIPDRATFDCLGGDDRRRGDLVPAYSMATVPYGGIATCPD